MRKRGSFAYPSPVLADEDANRIEFELARADKPTLVRWVKELLDDRRARSGLLQAEARRLAHLRQRLKQAADYLDGLALKAQEEVAAPWRGKLPCPQCGAAVSGVRAEQRPQGHAIVHDHPAGRSASRTLEVASHRSDAPPFSRRTLRAPCSWS